MIEAFRIEELANPGGEVLDIEGERLLLAVDEFRRRFLGLAESLRQRLHHLVAAENVAVSLCDPVRSGGEAEGVLEAVELAALRHVAFHVRDVRVIAAEALVLIKDAEEHREDRVPPVLGFRLALDVEQDNVGRRLHGPLDRAEPHGVVDLGVEELDVTTYSSSSCQTDHSSNWSALTTPLIGRNRSLANSSRTSTATPIHGTSENAR